MCSNKCFCVCLCVWRRGLFENERIRKCVFIVLGKRKYICLLLQKCTMFLDMVPWYFWNILDDHVLYFLQYMNMVIIQYHGTIPGTVVLPSDTTVPAQYFFVRAECVDLLDSAIIPVLSCKQKRLADRRLHIPYKWLKLDNLILSLQDV